MIRLIYTNPNPIPAHQSLSLSAPNSNSPKLIENPSSRESILASILPHFSTAVRIISPSSYTIVCRDLSHYLSCELPLEIRHTFDESDFGDVVCHFPIIQEKYLEALVWEDERLLDMIMIKFQLRILEQLFVFCATHNALRLVIHVDPLEIAQVAIYEEFISHTDQVLTHQGRKTALVIPTDRASYERLINNMEQINADLHHTLLQDSNPVVQQYLKFSSFAFSMGE